jgi:nitrite reductase/ring-hydroxylating ferredoxin subunit
MGMLTRVASVDQLPSGQMRAVTVGADAVAIANADGRVFAFGDTCPHMGCSLAEGSLTGTAVTCACHGSRFDVATGEVLRGPAEEGVQTWPVHLDGSSISVET